MRSFTATSNDNAMRLSRFVQRVTHSLPQNAMHKAFRLRRIKINGKRALPSYILKTGDLIELYLNDEYFYDKLSSPVPQPNMLLPNFDIIYEDEQLAILHKTINSLSHQDTSGKPSLLCAYINMLEDRGEFNPKAENVFAPTLCNRLDYGTEGLVIAAKTAPALREINAAIRLNLVEKHYLCICRGTPPNGMHTAFWQRNLATHTVQIFAENANGRKPITTGIEVLESRNGYSLCSVNLITGRTHQIRAHFAFLGCPLAGEHKYANPHKTPFNFTGQALCANSLTFSQTLAEYQYISHLAGKTFSLTNCHVLSKWQNSH